MGCKEIKRPSIEELRNALLPSSPHLYTNSLDIYGGCKRLRKQVDLIIESIKEKAIVVEKRKLRSKSIPYEDEWKIESKVSAHHAKPTPYVCELKKMFSSLDIAVGRSEVTEFVQARGYPVYAIKGKPQYPGLKGLKADIGLVVYENPREAHPITLVPVEIGDINPGKVAVALYPPLSQGRGGCWEFWLDPYCQGWGGEYLVFKRGKYGIETIRRIAERLREDKNQEMIS